MRTVNEYRPGRWALLEAGAVVETTTDPAEALAWLPPEPEDLVPGPLFAGDLWPLVSGQAPAVPQDETPTSGPALPGNVAKQAARDEARGLALVVTPAPAIAQDARPALVPHVASQATQDTARGGPAWLWLEVDGAGSSWWAAALAIWQRKTGRNLPERARARPDVLASLQPGPAGVTCETWPAVQPGTAWLGPL